MKTKPRIGRFLIVLAALAYVGAMTLFGHAWAGLSANSGSGGATLAPTPSPIPTPAFIVGGHGAGQVTSVTATGALAGDLFVLALSATDQFPSTNTAPYYEWLLAGSQFNTGNYLNVWIRPITPQDTTTISVNAPLSGASANTNGYCWAVYRNVIPTTDGLATVATGSSTAPAGNSITTTLANDLIVWAAATGGAGLISAAPSGYSLREAQTAVSGVSLGCAIADEVVVTPAALPTPAGMATPSSVWGVEQFAVQQVP